MSRTLRKNYALWGVFAFVLIGFVLRYYNLNWDDGLTFHPDERNIDAAVSRISFFDSLDPEFFAYGGLPVYLYRATAELVSTYTGDLSWLSNWGKINTIGRSFSVLFSTLTILAVYKLGRKLFDKRVGFLAAIFVALSPGLIQIAHFGITESFLALMVVLICLGSLKILEYEKLRYYLLTGSLFGVALAAKTSAVSFAIIPLTSVVISTFKRPIKVSRIFKALLFGLIFLIIASIFFLLLSPYTVLSWGKFLESMKYESGVVSGRLLVPYVLQFLKTTPYVFQINNLFWQMGLSVLAAITGFALILFSIIKHKDKRLIVLLSFPVVYFLYVGSWHTKFIRYMLPLIPFLSVFASFALLWIHDKSKRLGEVIIVFFVVTSVVWGLAFFSIYTKPQTRISASKWIYQNIDPGSKILGEHWDDGLPVHLSHVENRHNFGYDIDQLRIYDEDSSAKVSYLANELNNADYIILASRRLYGTLMFLPERYPVTSSYYRLLFGEDIGYEKVAEFSSYPEIFGLEINDDASEETFQVYDHPKIIIFKNTKTINEKEIRRKLILSG
ncbi:ArnT family glycosyltransferase [Patescibacteria group bacterium]